MTAKIKRKCEKCKLDHKGCTRKGGGKHFRGKGQPE